MRNASRSMAVVLVCVVLVGAGLCLAQDWPQWRGPNRDGKVTGFTAPQTWPKALTQKWKAQVGAGDATPALVDGKLYVFARQGGDEVVLSLDAAGGKELWKAKYAAQAIGGPSARQHSGPRSSPAVADGKVVVLGINGVVTCLDAAEGKVLWTKDPFPKTVPGFYTAMSPLIVDGMAILHLGGRGTGAIMAFDLASGAEKWKCDRQPAEYASPILMTVDGTKQIVTLTDNDVVGVGAADGKLLWSVAFAPARMAYNAATPIIDGQTVIFTGARRGTKAVQVAKSGDGFGAKELWSNPDLAVQFNTPVLKDALLFGLTDRGNLFCIDAKTGKTAWTDSAQHGRGFAAILDAGAVLLALPSTSELIAYAPSREKYTEVARIKVASSATYAHPVVAGKAIYVKDDNSLTMWTLE